MHVAAAQGDWARLTEFAVDARYPDDLPESDADEARAALADAEALITAAHRDLNDP